MLAKAGRIILWKMKASRTVKIQDEKSKTCLKGAWGSNMNIGFFQT